MRKRPGRFRRWLLRPVMWAAALLAVLVLALQLGLQTRWAGVYFAGLLESSLSRLLDRQVWAGSVHVKLLPLGVEVRDFRLGGPSPDDPPFLTVGRAVIDAEIVDLQRRTLTIHEVILEEPRIFLDFLGGPGNNNLPKVGKRSRGASAVRAPVQIDIRHLAIAGGELRIAQRRIPLEMTATALNAELSGGESGEVSGRVVAGRLDLQLPKANPFSAAVGLRAVLDIHGMRILNGRIGSPDLTAQVSGHGSWSDKEWVFEIKGQGNAELFKELGYLEDQIQGAFFLDGGYAWSQATWGFRAQVTSPYLRVLGREMSDVRTAVSGDRNGVLFDLEQALHAGGSIAGSINIETEKDRGAMEIDLSLDRVDLQQLADDQRIPVSGLSGRVSGVFDYRFPFGQAQAGRGWADLHISPEPGTSGEIPIEGSVPLLIENGVLRTRAARLTGPYQRINASGYFDIAARRASIDYQIESDRIARIGWLIPIDFPENSLWLPTAGTGTFEGTLEIEAGQASTELRLDLLDVVAPGVVADRVQGVLTISRAGLDDMRLELLRPNGGLIVLGSIPFGDSEATGRPAVPFGISVDAAGWPMEQIQAWLPATVPVDGPVFGSVQLWGDLNRLAGQLRGWIRPAMVGALELEELELWAEFDPQRTEVKRLAMVVPAGEVVLAGSLDMESRWLELDLRAADLEMNREPFAALMPGGLSGRLAIDGDLSGPIETPRLAADLEWSDLELGGETLGRDGGSAVRIVLHDAELEASGDFVGLVELEGGGRLDATGFDLVFDLSSSVIEDLVLLTGLQPTTDLAGSFEGKLLIAGDLDPARPWRAALELSRFQIAFRGFELENLEPVVASLEEDSVWIESFFIGEPEGVSELFLNGRIGLEPTQLLDLHMQSSLDTNWLELILPDLGLRSGRFELLTTIRGTADAPQLNGQGRLFEGRAIVEGLPFTIDRIGGTLLFDPGQIIIDDLRAQAAGGELRASGTVNPFSPTGEIDYRIQVLADNFEVPFPEGWSTRGRADLVFGSFESGHQIRGSVDVERALYVEDLDLGLTQVLSGLFARRRLQVDKAEDLTARTELNVAVRGLDALRVRNNVADLHGSLDLLVRGTLSRPAVFGRVDLQPEGKLVLGPNEYLIERGTLRFANPLKIEPIVDVVARADVREYDITLNLTGTFEDLNLRYSSNPPLADLEVLSLLTTGEENWVTGSSIGRTQDRSAEQAAELLYGQAASLVTQRTGRLFGLDRFRVQPLTKASGELSTARVTLGKQLSRDVYLTYSYDPTSTADDVIELEWKVQRGITLKLRQTGSESYGVDVLWRKTVR